MGNTPGSDRTGVSGVLGLGPFELRVQFAHGVDIGGLIPERDDNGNSTWVPNISLHSAYF